MRYRLSRLAEADLARILAHSGRRWGAAGRARYTALLAAAMRMAAADPNGRLTHDRGVVRPGIRSLHIRYARHGGIAAPAHPVHILFYRAVAPGLVEIVRVLHERMDPGPSLGADPKEDN